MKDVGGGGGDEEDDDREEHEAFSELSNRCGPCA